MNPLKDKTCTPCPVNGQELAIREMEELLEHLSSSWKILAGPNRLSFSVPTKNFVESLEKAQIVGKIAEEQWHHPELTIGFKKFDLEIYTHVINGLREADFIFAAKVDDLFGLAPR